MSVAGTFRILAQISEILDSGENRSGDVLHKLDIDVRLKTGTGSGQADVVWSDRRTLAGAGSEVLDLAGSLTNSYGGTVTFAKVKAVFIRNRATTDGYDLRAGPDATNGWVGMFLDATDRIRVAAGGCHVWYDPNGQAVTAGSTDELFVQNDGAGSVDYDIVIIGTSA